MSEPEITQAASTPAAELRELPQGGSDPAADRPRVDRRAPGATAPEAPGVSSAPTAEDGLPPPARNRAMGAIMLGIALSALDGSLVNLALPGIAADLGVAAAQTIWVVNAYQIAVVALLLPFATLGDRLGYRRVYLGGVALFSAASLGCLLSGSLPMLVGFRALQGIGAAGIMGVSAALLRSIWPQRLLGRGMATNSMVIGAAAVAGPSISAVVLSVASWPWLFAINLPLGLVLLLGGSRALPADAPPAVGRARSWWGDAGLNAAMFALVFIGIAGLGGRMGDSAAHPPLTMSAALLVGGAAIGAVYLRRQWSQPLPMFPLDLLRIARFRLAMVASICAFAAQMLAHVALPFLLLDVQGRSPAQVGLLMTAWPLALVIVAPLAGRLIGRVDDGLLGGVGMALLALGMVLLTSLPATAAPPEIAARLALCGAGFALFQSPNNHTLVGSAPRHRAGAASGMLGTARLLGQTSGAVTLALVLHHGGTSADAGALHAAFAIAAAFAVAAGLASVLRLRPDARSQAPG